MAESRDLPNDLLPEILSKLPVKSLLRFRSVSKQFRRIIHDPKFVKSYNNHPESQISVISPERGKIVRKVRCSKDFRVDDNILGIESNFPTKILRSAHLRFKWIVIGSFNGLFILENRILRRQRFWRFFFMFWNPSLRRFHLLPETPQPPDLNGRTILYGGMGFDPSIEDYKYIGFGVKTTSLYVLETVFVYTFGTNSWKTILFEAKGCPNISWRSVCDSSFHDSTVSIHGALYFIAWNPHYIYGAKTCRYLVFSYNLSTEEFSAANSPVLGDDENDGVDNHEINWTLKCASDGSSLALVGFGANRGSIWWGQGEGGELSWSKRYAIGLAIPVVIGFPWRTYVSVLNVDRNRMGGGEEEAVLLVKLENCLKSYNVKTQEEKEVFRFRRRTNIVNVSPYVESLMLLNS